MRSHPKKRQVVQPDAAPRGDSSYSVLYVKALVGAFNQEKALVGAFSVNVQPINRFAALDLGEVPGDAARQLGRQGDGALQQAVAEGVFCK